MIVIAIKKKHNILFWLFIIIISGYGYLKRDKLFIYYIESFHKNSIVSHFNNRGQLDGEYLAYINGKIYGKSYYKNGQLDGPCIWYDDNTGKVKREVFYKHGMLNGTENVYYKNGNLNYTCTWKHDKRFNSEYHYLDNGILNTYNAFDNNKNFYDSFLYVVYDSAGKIHQMLGHVFSPFIYSIVNDTTTALIDNAKYKSIKDLYINVATPPQITLEMDACINGAMFKKTYIKANTLVIPNIFSKIGLYHVFILGRFKNNGGTTVKTDTLKTTIFKE